MRYEQFLALLRQDKDFNFIATALTPWWTNGIDACLIYLKDKCFNAKGYILLVPHYKTGLGVLPKNFITDNENIKFIRIDNSPAQVQQPMTFKLRLRTKIKNFLGDRLYFFLMMPINAVRKRIRKIRRYSQILKLAEVPVPNDKDSRDVVIITPGVVDYSYMLNLQNSYPYIVPRFIITDEGAGTLLGYYNPDLIDKFFNAKIYNALAENSRLERFTLIDRDINTKSANIRTQGGGHLLIPIQQDTTEKFLK